MTVTVDDLLARLGGAEAAARLTGVGLEAIRKWRQAGAIPAKALGGGERRRGFVHG